jgi:uncharacterized membrane protein
MTVKPKPRVIHNPNDVAALALMQIDSINMKKDELTVAIKSLSDLTRQLVRVYGEHMRTIKELSERVKVLEGKEKGEAEAA